MNDSSRDAQKWGFQRNFFWVWENFDQILYILELDPAVHGRGRLRLCCMFREYAGRKLECSVQSCAEDQNFEIVRCPLFDDLPYLDFGVYQEIDSYSIFFARDIL